MSGMRSAPLRTKAIRYSVHLNYFVYIAAPLSVLMLLYYHRGDSKSRIFVFALLLKKGKQQEKSRNIMNLCL